MQNMWRQLPNKRLKSSNSFIEAKNISQHNCNDSQLSDKTSNRVLFSYLEFHTQTLPAITKKITITIKLINNFVLAEVLRDPTLLYRYVSKQFPPAIDSSILLKVEFKRVTRMGQSSHIWTVHIEKSRISLD